MEKLMGRYHFLGRARDSYGNIKPSIGINVYLAGTTTPATVFADVTGGTGIATVPQVLSDINGLFSFYVDEDVNPPPQLFDFVVNSITYPNVNVYTGFFGTHGTFSSITITGDYSDGTLGRVVNIYYGTDATPPAAISGAPDGSLYVQYIE
jgi:hypothetical protein